MKSPLLRRPGFAREIRKIAYFPVQKTGSPVTKEKSRNFAHFLTVPPTPVSNAKDHRLDSHEIPSVKAPRICPRNTQNSVFSRSKNRFTRNKGEITEFRPLFLRRHRPCQPFRSLVRKGSGTGIGSSNHSCHHEWSKHWTYKALRSGLYTNLKRRKAAFA